MATRIRVIEAYSDSDDENQSFGLDVGFNTTLRRVEIGYSDDDRDLNFPYDGIDALIEALKRIQTEHAE